MTDPFGGRLFGPGLSGAGVEARAQWREDGALELTTAEMELLSVLEGIVAGGFNAQGLHLALTASGDRYILVVDREVDRRLCLQTAPPRHADKVATAAGRRGQLDRRFRLAWVVLGLLLVLPLLLLGGVFLAREPLADWVVERIPYAQEAQLGQLVLAQTRLRVKVEESGPAVAAVAAIGDRLVGTSPHRYRWFVAADESINAFAAPGGIVVVHAGLLRAADSAEEVAGVLAHEIAHAELRHGLRLLVKGLGLRALAGLALGDWSGSAAAELAQHLTELGFSREAEKEADRDGLRRLVAARIDPQGLVRFLERLAETDRLTPPALFSSHPPTTARIARLRQEVAGFREIWRPLQVDLMAAQQALPSP